MNAGDLGRTRSGMSPTRRLLTRIDGTASGLTLLNRCTAIRTGAAFRQAANASWSFGEF